MCGINGIITISEGRFDVTKSLELMQNSLYHRGPDGRDVWETSVKNTKIGFGHTRLAIIDVTETGKQPMMDPDTGNVIVFNGEIYNFGEIKQSLIKKGYFFTSNSDTEVILKAYHCYGIKCLDHFIGMFALTIFDKSRNQIFMARDRAGVKPLYFYKSNDILLFSSELKAFYALPGYKKKIDVNVVADYMKHGWIPAPHTIMMDTFKFLPGNYALVDLSTLEMTFHEYWNVLDYYNKPKFNISYQDAKAELEDLLISSCEYRMVSDVPVGVFLSGGYDSSVVAAVLQSDRTDKIKTFSIGFEDKNLDEAHFAKEVATHLGTDHHEFYFNEHQILAKIDRLAYYYDEPFGDSSAMPTMLVSEMASKYVKVALSADGGDELFVGYPRYYTNFDSYSKFASFPFKFSKHLGKTVACLSHLPISPLKRNKLEKIAEVWQEQNLNSRWRYRSEPKHFRDQELKDLFKSDIVSISSNYDQYCLLADGLEPIENMLAIEYKTTLVDDMLVKVDRAMMSYSMEGREPLLDHRLTEYAARLPLGFKYDGVTPKKILKDIVHQYLPKSMMDRPKMGFGIPTEKWLKGQLKEYVLDAFDEKKLNEQKIFNINKTNELVNNFFNGTEKNAEKIWFFVVFQMWYARWIKN